MSHFAITPPLIATGTINVASFVKQDTASDEAVVQAGVGDTAIGVSYPGINAAPGTPGAGTAAAVSGQACTIYGPGSIVEVQVGSVNITRGYVSPDVNGLAINSVAGQFATALSFESANASEFVRMMVLPPNTRVPGPGLVSTAVSVAATAAQSGTTFVVTAADKVITLPTAVADMEFTVVATGTGATGGSTGTTVAVQSTDSTGGNGFTAAAGKGAIDTHGTAVDGDWIRFFATAANTWYIVGIKGTWARVS